MRRRSDGISPASKAQREKIAGVPCVCCHVSPCDPAHVIPRSMLTDRQDDPRAVIPLCRSYCHRAYDEGRLDLVPHERRFPVEMGFAVERFGLVATYRRVTNDRSPS